MKKLFLFALLALVSASSVFSQTKEWTPSNGALLDGKNIFKVNLTSMALGNYGFYGERIINNRFSAVLGVNFMPNQNIPFINSLKVVEQDVEGTINNIKINSLALIPELRIYTGKGYGKGFYLAPYFKYEQFGLSNLTAEFTDNNDVPRQVYLDGKIKTYSGGLMIGYQWLIGKNKNFVIDWSMLGAHAGTSKGNLHGIYSGVMTAKEQQDVRNSIDDTLGDISLIKYTSKVDSKNTDVDIKGPWAFFRMGVSIGYRF
jgi:hypothetical protein